MFIAMKENWFVAIQRRSRIQQPYRPTGFWKFYKRR